MGCFNSKNYLKPPKSQPGPTYRIWWKKFKQFVDLNSLLCCFEDRLCDIETDCCCESLYYDEDVDTDDDGVYKGLTLDDECKYYATVKLFAGNFKGTGTGEYTAACTFYAIIDGATQSIISAMNNSVVDIISDINGAGATFCNFPAGMGITPPKFVASIDDALMPTADSGKFNVLFKLTDFGALTESEWVMTGEACIISICDANVTGSSWA